MWEKYATSSCDRLRAENPPPTLDADGLFTPASVIEFAGRRQCTVMVQSDLVLTVTAKAATSVVAFAPGRWDPVSILAACTRAQEREAFEVDESTAEPENLNGLYEIRIARVVAADGLRPYLIRTGKYEIDDELAQRGMQTLAFLSLLSGQGREYYVVRRALRALEDVGLVVIKPGQHGGMSSAEITWTDSAYISRRAPVVLDEHNALTDEEDRAIADLIYL
jgi:hypothetical protein